MLILVLSSFELLLKGHYWNHLVILMCLYHLNSRFIGLQALKAGHVGFVTDT